MYFIVYSILEYTIVHFTTIINNGILYYAQQWPEQPRVRDPVTVLQYYTLLKCATLYYTTRTIGHSSPEYEIQLLTVLVAPPPVSAAAAPPVSAAVASRPAPWIRSIRRVR